MESPSTRFPLFVDVTCIWQIVESAGARVFAPKKSSDASAVLLYVAFITSKGVNVPTIEFDGDGEKVNGLNSESDTATTSFRRGEYAIFLLETVEAKEPAGIQFNPSLEIIIGRSFEIFDTAKNKESLDDHMTSPHVCPFCLYTCITDQLIPSDE
jgi:hypothetical protein